METSLTKDSARCTSSCLLRILRNKFHFRRMPARSLHTASIRIQPIRYDKFSFLAFTRNRLIHYLNNQTPALFRKLNPKTSKASSGWIDYLSTKVSLKCMKCLCSVIIGGWTHLTAVDHNIAQCCCTILDCIPPYQTGAQGNEMKRITVVIRNNIGGSDELQSLVDISE